MFTHDPREVDLSFLDRISLEKVFQRSKPMIILHSTRNKKQAASSARSEQKFAIWDNGIIIWDSAKIRIQTRL